MAYSKSSITKIVNHVCKEMIKGRAMRNILIQDKDMPTAATFFNFLTKSDELLKQYSRANIIRADLEFDELLSISDSDDGLYFIDKHGVKRIDPSAVQLKNTKIHARQWRIGKLNAKKYSDKVQIDLSEFKEQPLFDIDEAVDNSSE